MDWFDPSDDVIVEPLSDGLGHWRRRYGLDEAPAVDALIFANNGLGKLLDATCRALDAVAECLEDHRARGYARYRLANGRAVSVCRAPEPAPYCAADLDFLLASGASQVLFLNGSGSLDPGLPAGSLVTPVELVREEGTSYHYVPANVALETDLTLRCRVREAAASLGAVVAEGGHWTTDALYRETEGKVARLREQGVLTVDMELSALAGVAHYYRRPFAALVVVTDVVRKPHTWGGVDTLAFAHGVEVAAAVAARVFG